MTKWFVGRHGGATEWARAHGLADATFIEHLDIAMVKRGDTVMGTLPVNVAAQLCAKGARYIHLAIDVPAAARGRDLSPAEMDRYGARLVEYRVRSRARLRRWIAGFAQLLGSHLHPFQALGRASRKYRSWATRRPWRMLLSLALLGFFVVSLPSFIWNRLASLWACVDAVPACEPTLLGMRGGGVVVVAVAYLAIFYLIATLVAAVLWSRLRQLTGRDARCRALIMGLSNLNDKGLNMVDEVIARFAGQPQLYALPKHDFARLVGHQDGGTIRKEEVGGLALQWQQNVRIVQHHLPALERVVVLPSVDSLAQWDRFLEVMKAFFPGLPVDLVAGTDGDAFRLPINSSEKDRSFEDYDYVRDGLDRAVDQIRAAAAGEGRPIGEGDICIDVTAGPKTFSVAGAIVTLNRDLKLSYVSNEGLVSIYDAQIGTAEALPVG